MIIRFLGTGSWKSKDRKPTCLYIQSCGFNLLFECPSGVESILESEGLSLPDAIFVSSMHPHSLDRISAEKVRMPGVPIYLLHGAKLGPISVKTEDAGCKDRAVAFSLSVKGEKIVAFIPKYTRYPRLAKGARYTIQSPVGDGMRPVSPSVTQRDTVAHQMYINVDPNHFNVLQEHYNSVRIPNDGEVIRIMNNPGVYLHRAGLAQLVADEKITAIIKSSPFQSYINRPIFLCSDEGVHAKVQLSEGKEIDRSGFRESVPRHGMLEMEAKTLWPGFQTLYIFDVQVQERYEIPVDYTRPNGYCAFIESVSAEEPEHVNITEMVKKEGNTIILYDEDGEKVLGRFPFGEGEKYKTEESAREAAAEREKQVKMFRHMDEDEQEDLGEESWTAEYVNDLPDSAFLFIEPDCEKDDSGKSIPRSKRHLPYKDSNNKVDLAHLRNAISRLGQPETGKDWKGFDEAKRKSLQVKAQGILNNMKEERAESSCSMIIRRGNNVEVVSGTISTFVKEDSSEQILVIDIKEPDEVTEAE